MHEKASKSLLSWSAKNIVSFVNSCRDSWEFGKNSKYQEFMTRFLIEFWDVRSANLSDVWGLSWHFKGVMVFWVILATNKITFKLKETNKW